MTESGSFLAILCISDSQTVPKFFAVVLVTFNISHMYWDCHHCQLQSQRCLAAELSEILGARQMFTLANTLY